MLQSISLKLMNESTFQWLYPLAAQFCPNDSKLMVSGRLSEISGEIAIFDTGRDSQSRPSSESIQHKLELQPMLLQKFKEDIREYPRFKDNFTWI